jgi:hypothetical protein
MRTIRFSIGGLMGIVLIAAISLAALRNANAIWAGVMLLLTCAVLGMAILGVVCRRQAQRAWWLGFALFGWGYLALAVSWPLSHWIQLPTVTLLEVLALKLGARPSGMGGGMGVDPLIPPLLQVGHCLWALLAAVLGGMLARALFALPAGRSESSATLARPGGQPPRKRWLRPAMIAPAASILVTSAATICSPSAPGVWAGATLLLTWGLLGLLVLGAIFGRGRHREVWLGAALFGAGYLLLTLGRSPIPAARPFHYLAIDQFLNALRPWFPPIPNSLVAENARIRRALDLPIPMRFPNETPLEVVLKYIKQVTTTRFPPGIPIYVDPLGLQEAERSLNSTVQIDLEGVPLKTTLRLCLNQLGMDYSVKDGFLMISSEDAISTDLEDPFLIVGHCLLALIAAAMGGVAAPLISDEHSGPPGPVAGEDAPVPARSSKD